jgi:hypothetical protein
MSEHAALLPLKDEIIFAHEPWRCNLCECADISDEAGQWILYQLSFVKQEGTRDTAEERMLTMIINLDVLTRTGEENIEWLRSLFLDKWLDYSLSTHWRISKLRGVEEMLGEHSA